MVLDERAKKEYHLDHPRAGDLVAIAEDKSWFAYYYWLDDNPPPTTPALLTSTASPATSSRTPTRSHPEAAHGKGRLQVAKKQLGFRYLMDVIGLDASVVKGSHGRLNAAADGPLLIASHKDLPANIEPTAICGLILNAISI